MEVGGRAGRRRWDCRKMVRDAISLALKMKKEGNKLGNMSSLQKQEKARKWILPDSLVASRRKHSPAEPSGT